jgi:hypothetical protein
MRNETVTSLHGRRIVLMDSISLIGPEDADSIIICGSHGGLISGAFASMHPPRLVVFNDAGGGKKDAGVASLADLEREGIAAAAVSHDSARIGDALDAWENGVVSRTNGPAAEGGLAPGRQLREVLQRFTPKEKVR